MLQAEATGNVKLPLQLTEPLPLVLIDRAHLEGIVISLVGDARDAMPNGGSLTKTTDVNVPDRMVRLTACDTGVGMSQAMAKRVFDPFFTTRDVGQGSGLGLSAVYGLVSRSAGRIRVDSAVGQGTTFIIEWPVADE